MTTLLRSEGLWKIVEKGFAEPEDESRLTAAQRKEYEAEVMTDAKALSKIQNAVTNEIFPRISRANTAKEAWEILAREFQGDSKAKTIKLQSLRRAFHNLKMRESECIQDYSSRVTEVVNQMRTLGEDLSDQKVVEKILISLPEKYDPIVVAIEESKDITSLSIEQLMGSLKSHEQRRLGRNEETVESAFQSKLTFKPHKFIKKGSTNPRDVQRMGDKKWKKVDFSRNNDKGMISVESKPACKVCNKTNHATAKCWFRGKPKCSYCSLFGHTDKSCRFRETNQANFSQKKHDDDDEDGVGNLFFAYQAAFEEKKNT